MKYKINAIATSLFFFRRDFWLLRKGLPSLIGGTGLVLFLQQKRTKMPRLTNICSDSLNKSLTLNPSRVIGSALLKVPATLLRIAWAVLFERNGKKIYLTIPPNLQRPTLLDGYAMELRYVDSVKWRWVTEYGIISYLKKLAACNQDHQRYRKEEEHRLLPQRGLKHERSLERGHWTNNHLNHLMMFKTIFYSVRECFAFLWRPYLQYQKKQKAQHELLQKHLRIRYYRKQRLAQGSAKQTWWKLCLLLFFYLPVQGQQKLQALKIGDQVPNLVFENIINYKSSTAKLSDFKGKLVILDFWATWCSPCVAMIPKMDSLQNEFNGKLQFLSVAYQTRKVIQDYLSKLEKDRGFKVRIPQLTNDTRLTSLFPHHSLPHYVWINQKGIVAAITGYEEVNETNISAALTKDTQGLMQKRDAKKVPYDASKSLFIDGNGGSVNPVYHRVFSGYQQGLSLRFRMQKQGDSIMVITGTNQNISNLFSMAYSNGNGMIPKKRVLLQSAYPKRLRSEAHGQPYRDWMAEGNVFCYELRVPIANQSKAFELMQQDMDLLFPHFKGRLEKKMIPCLVLEAITEKGSYLTKGGDPEMHFDLNSALMQNAYLNHLIIRLDNYNLSKDPRPIINGVGNDARVDLNLQCNLSDVYALNKALAPYGLALVEQEREMEVLVISDRKEARL